MSLADKELYDMDILYKENPELIKAIEKYSTQQERMLSSTLYFVNKYIKQVIKETGSFNKFDKEILIEGIKKCLSNY